MELNGHGFHTAVKHFSPRGKIQRRFLYTNSKQTCNESLEASGHWLGTRAEAGSTATLA